MPSARGHASASLVITTVVGPQAHGRCPQGRALSRPSWRRDSPPAFRARRGWRRS